MIYQKLIFSIYTTINEHFLIFLRSKAFIIMTSCNNVTGFCLFFYTFFIRNSKFWLFLTFLGLSTSLVLNLFLIYNQKFSYASLLISDMKFLFVLAQLRASSCTWISVLLIVQHLLLFVHYLHSKYETLFFCWGWLVLNLFLNFEQKCTLCSYKIVLVKSV